MPATLTVLAPRDPNLYANLTDTPAGVVVQFCRRALWSTSPRCLLGAVTVDAPFHLVADRVYDLLWDLDR